MVILLVFGTGDGGSTPLGTIQIFTVGYPMENVLVVGVNTRGLACSLKKLGYTVYSADYFGVIDLKPCVEQYRSVLSQEPYQSCGIFKESFKSESVEQLAGEFADRSDHIICLAGVSPENFPKKKVMGNHQVEDIDDKYRFYKKLKNKFHFPPTFQVSDIGEAVEIADNYPEKSFILKPRKGSGGYGIHELSNIIKSDVECFDLSNYILQEKLDGQNLSASILSTGIESETILTSQQIIGDVGLNQKEPFGYCGNISPYTDKIINRELKDVSEEIILQLSLVGSNGVDFILKDDELYLLEVNPRIQGTMESAELSLNINMAEAHLDACNGKLMEIPSPERFSVKMVVHAPKRSQAGDLSFPGVYDLPNQNVIIEKGEPIATVINSELIREDTISHAKTLVNRVYRSIKQK